MNDVTSSKDPPPENRRRMPRARTLRAGKLLFGGLHKTSIDCLILDLSDSGVHIETAVMINIPETGFLKIQDEIIGPLQKRWASGNQIGFDFVTKKD